MSPRLTAVLDFEPGWHPGDDGDREEQTLRSLRLVSEEPFQLGVLLPVTFSEPAQISIAS